MPAGNMLLSAAILFAGGSSTKTLQILQHMRVATISKRTYFLHHQYVLEPALQHQWELHQHELMHQAGGADSPGHSAKYGVYSAMELDINKVFDLQLVQVV